VEEEIVTDALHHEIEARVRERTASLTQEIEHLRAALADKDRIERELRVSEGRFRAIFEQSPLSTQILASDGRTTTINRAYEELWGLTLADLAAWHPLTEPQLEQADVVADIRKAFAGEATISSPLLYDARSLNATGHIRWVQGFQYPIKDDAGHVGEVVLMHQDVTALKQAERLARRQNKMLTRTLHLLASEPDLDKFLGHVITAIAEQLDVLSSHLFFYDPVQNMLRLHITYENGNVYLGNMPGAVPIPEYMPTSRTPFWSTMLQQRRPVVMNDLAHNPLIWPEHRQWHLEAGVKVALAIPLMVGEQAMGFFGVRRTTHDSFSPDELALALALTQQASLAVQLTRLANQNREAAVLAERERAAQEQAAMLAEANAVLQRRDRILNGVAHVSQRLLECEDLDEALQDALEILGEASDMDRVYIFQDMFDAATNQNMAVCPYEWTASGVLRTSDIPDRYPMSYEGFGDWLSLLHRGQPVLGFARDLPDEGRHLQELDAAVSLLAVPIVVEQHLWGLLGFDDCHQERIWHESEIAVLQTAAASIAAAIERRDLLREREAALQQRAAQLAKANEALRRNIDSLATQANLDTFLGRVLLEIVAQLRAVGGDLFLYDPALHLLSLHLVVRDGKLVAWQNEPDMALLARPVPADVTRFWERLVRARTPLVFDLHNAEHDDNYWPGTRAWHQRHGHTRFMCVALMLGDRPLGFLGLPFRDGATFAAEDVELAYTLTQQATLAIELTRLAEHARQSAVLAERTRLAREIHDTLAQGFTGIIVQLQAAQDAHTTNDTDRQAHFVEATRLAKRSLAEARRSVQALRPSELVNTDVGGALTRLAQQMTANSDVQITCTVVGVPIPLPPEQESHLLRITQEAVTNTLRHAQARHVNIQLVYEGMQVRLVVQDDGQGFDPHLLADGHFGLLGMQERAREIGGSVSVVSEPAHGTTITVSVPVVPQRAEWRRQ